MQEIIKRALNEGIVVHCTRDIYHSHKVALEIYKGEYVFKYEEPIITFGGWDDDYLEYETKRYKLKDYGKTWWLKGERSNNVVIQRT